MIRPASEQDEAALRALDVANWSWELSPAPPPAPDSPFLKAGDRPEDVLVAVVDDEIAGYVKLGPVTPLASNAHVLGITGLAVDTARRGRGLGRRLVSAAVREAATRGARRLTLRVLATNTAARGLYEACGFRVEGVLREEFWLEGATWTTF